MGSLLFLSSCATQRGIMQDRVMNDNKGRLAYNETSHFFFWGLGQEDTIDVLKICKRRSNVSYVESKLTGSNGFLTAITLGLYAPRNKKVYCKK